MPWDADLIHSGRSPDPKTTSGTAAITIISRTHNTTHTSSNHEHHQPSFAASEGGRAAGAALIDVATAPAPASAGFALARAPQRQVGVGGGEPLRDVALLGRGQRRRDASFRVLVFVLISSASLTPPTSYTLIGPALLVPAARFCAQGGVLVIASIPEWRGGRSADRRTIFICRVSETRLVRTQRGAARPMTRDARLSALHRSNDTAGII